ncbi:MAG: flagellar assembly protein FliW [Actinomycetota bacterium]|jgi:flagellar assembly factor FliW|nr:flagellar assembly protein FliW [Actinomycetota bacterium]
MKINTTRFGEIEVHRDKVITLLEGVIGFEQHKEFILLDFAQDSPLKWLQSIDDPSLAFVVCDPWHFFEDYKPNITKEQKKGLESGKNEIIFLTIATVPADISKVSLNLLSPIIVSLDKMLGKQIILFESDYGTKHYIFKTLKIKQKKFSESKTKSKSI